MSFPQRKMPAIRFQGHPVRFEWFGKRTRGFEPPSPAKRRGLQPGEKDLSRYGFDPGNPAVGNFRSGAEQIPKMRPRACSSRARFGKFKKEPLPTRAGFN